MAQLHKSRETLFSTKDRSAIIRECLHSGAWEGARKRFSIHFMYDKHAPIGAQIVWGVAIHRKWVQGTSANVFDAMNAVENKVANRSLDAREAKMAVLKFEEANNV